jgi:hypothetical protein
VNAKDARDRSEIDDRVKSWECIPSDVDESFYYEDTYRNLEIHTPITADSSFRFYLMGHWTNDYFSQPGGIFFETNHDTIRVYSFNGERYYHPLFELDLYTLGFK